MKLVQELYKNRMAALGRIAGANASDHARWRIPPNGGFYAGIEIQGRKSASEVVRELAKRNILLKDICDNYLDGFNPDNILRISVANAGLDDMESGIPQIASLLSGRQHVAIY